MPSPLDFIEEKSGPEPRVLTADVQAILRIRIRPGEDDGDASVQTIADKAGISTRTVYRVLQGDKETIGLDLADRLVLAAGSHLRACRLVFPDGTIQDY